MTIVWLYLSVNQYKVGILDGEPVWVPKQRMDNN